MPATLTLPAPTAPPHIAPACRRVQDLLRGSCRPELRRLTAVETELEVILVGRVPTHHLKQLALELIRPVADGRLIVIRLVVAC